FRARLKSFPRPSGRGRIETRHRPRFVDGLGVSPGIRVGGGLKLTAGAGAAVKDDVSPGLRVGGGLKLFMTLVNQRGGIGFPRPSGRGRIETFLRATRPSTWSRFPRPSGRGRIETGNQSRWMARASRVSPGLRVGGGLKQNYWAFPPASARRFPR